MGWSQLNIAWDLSSGTQAIAQLELVNEKV